MKGLTDRDYRVVKNNILEELELGSYGNMTMVLALMVLEGEGKEIKTNAEVTDKCKGATTIA